MPSFFSIPCAACMSCSGVCQMEVSAVAHFALACTIENTLLSPSQYRVCALLQGIACACTVCVRNLNGFQSFLLFYFACWLLLLPLL